MSLKGTMFGPSDEVELSGSSCVSMKTPATPTATAARASVATKRRSPPESRPLPARLLHGMRGVENDRRADLFHDRQGAHVGDQRVVAEGGAALGDEHVCVARAPVTLATTFFMSHGARNCPFFTLTTLPVFAAATSRVGLARQEGRDLQHVDDLREDARTAPRYGRRSAPARRVPCAGPRKTRKRRLQPRAARGAQRRAVRLVEAGLVDEADPELLRQFLQLARHVEGVSAPTPAGDGGTGDERKRRVYWRTRPGRW